MVRTAFFVSILLAISLPAQAADVMIGQLKISAAWARATPKGASIGGGYMTVTNMGNEPDRLVGGASDVAKQVEVHEMSMDNGVMKMRMLSSGLEIKPGQTVTLKPGGYHIMFTGLKEPLKQGEHFEATLTFAKAGKAEVDFTVEGLGAMQGAGAAPMPADHGGMQMKH
jgi:copper(I)-binding protein